MGYMHSHEKWPSRLATRLRSIALLELTLRAQEPANARVWAATCTCSSSWMARARRGGMACVTRARTTAN